ncbi:MAG TPA: sugar phosphate isomerase/epimerase family protein [Fimbriimonas sp.]|nr:sugar phosphate isomerase/epimerase family protein [Fimbriimonas sp.]
MKLSCQLYTVRDQFSADPVGTLIKLRDMGLTYVEGGGSFGGESPAEGRKILDDLGLKASGSHVGMDTWNENTEGAIEDAKTIGCHYVIVPWIDKSYYAEGWDKFARVLEGIGKKVKDAGLVLCYHNHAFEFEDDGLNKLYDAADPDLVKAQLDVAWCQIGGGNPAEYIRKLSSRLPLLHLKDFDPSKTPQWRPGGQGLVDWDATLAAANEGNVEFGAIELDESPGDPIDAVRESVEFFRSKGITE